jgi:hypothetical protein
MTKAKRVHSTPPLNSSAIPTAAKGLSRRAELAGLAILPAALPATAAASADPIFAAIEAFHKAYAACIAVKGDIPDEVFDLYHAAHGL